MTRLPKQLIAGVHVGTTAAALYTVPTGVVTTISAMTATNTTASATTLKIYLVPAAGTAGVANAILWAAALPANSTITVGSAIGQTIPAGASIQAAAGAGSTVTLVASGYEFTP